MTRQHRLFAALRRQPLDRVPYATYNFHPYADPAKPNAHMADPTYRQLLDYVERTAPATIKIGSGLGTLALTDPKAAPVHSRLEGSGDNRMRIATLQTPRGELTSIQHAPEGKPGMVAKALLTSDEDIDKYMSIPYQPPPISVETARRLGERAGDRALIFVGFPEAMYAVASQLNFEDFCVRCVTDLPGILRIIQWAQERCVENMRRLVQAYRGMNVVLHTSGPEVCTPPMLSPDLFGILVTPYLRELIRIIHDGGLLAAVHCHGHVREIFPEILKTGADLLEPIEPPDQGNIGIEELMKQAQGRIGLMGHIQDQEFYTAPPGFMTQRVQQIARVVNGQTGYIMSPTCTPFDHPCTPTYQRNYLEWMQAAEKYLR